MSKTYTEMTKYLDYIDRYNYLRLQPSSHTFDEYRFMNQRFYRSNYWKYVRNAVIIRDDGCDLGIKGWTIPSGELIVHHIQPISYDDIINNSTLLTDMDNLITVSRETHNAIHNNMECPIYLTCATRQLNDTIPWR